MTILGTILIVIGGLCLAIALYHFAQARRATRKTGEGWGTRLSWLFAMGHTFIAGRLLYLGAILVLIGVILRWYGP
jgi:hypothetical protein